MIVKNRLWTTLASGVCALAIAGAAAAQSSVAFNIPAGDLKSGLEAYARQSNLELVYRVDDVEGSIGKSVRGDLPPLQALRQLLDGSPFEVRRASSGAYVVVRAALQPAAAAPVRSSLVPISTNATTAIQAAPAPAPVDLEPFSVEEIIVTGSRIARQDLIASSPLAVVGREDLQSSGSVSLENVLNQFPQLAGGRTSTVNGNGGAGILTANLRSLGSARTLVLVNGRRFLPADSEGTVDLASIPDALIERVDIVTGGASAVYGSDAIAGAVNFVMKRNFEGLEFSYSRAQTEEGDGGSNKLDLTLGANLDGGRGNVVLALSYADRDEVLQGSREFSAVPLDTVGGVLTPGGSGAVPGTRIGLSASQLASLNGVNLNPTGACSGVTGVVFRENGTPGAYCNPEDAYNYAPFLYLQRPLERFQVSSLARYQVTDRVEAYAEAFYVQTTNQQRIAPDSRVLATPGAGPSTLRVPDYAINPILTPAVRDFFINNAHIFDADGDGTALVVGSQRRFDEVGTRDSTYDRSALGLTLGLQGDVSLFGSSWRWDAFYQYQHNRADVLQDGYVATTRLSQALNAELNGAGDVVCVDTSSNCVPVGVFGYGSITPEAVAFLAPTRANSSIFERQVAGASIAGDLFQLPAGPLSVALGVEYRDDYYDFRPSPLEAEGAYGNVIPRMTGGYDLTEVFGEFRAPIVVDLPFVHELTLEGAVRAGNYSTIGDVFTWKLGMEYAPVNWFRFRTAYNEAIRAPNINELYSVERRAPQSVEDPCIASRNPTAAQQQLCIAQGIAAADLPTFTQSSPQLDVLTGGNLSLSEETSETFTFGAVISPPWISGLNLAIDYFDIQVRDAITSINANQTLNECFRTLDQSSAACQSIQRLSNGQIGEIRSYLQNIGAMSVNGLDVQADYRFFLPDGWGVISDSVQVNLSAQLSWLFERSIEAAGGGDAIDCAGYFGGGCTGSAVPGTPDFKMRLGASFNDGPLNVRVGARMIGDMEIYPNVTAAIEEVSAQWYADLSARYEVNERVELYGGVENLFDKAPPIQGVALTGDANTDVALYDVLGRRFYAGVRLRF